MLFNHFYLDDIFMAYPLPQCLYKGYTLTNAYRIEMHFALSAICLGCFFLCVYTPCFVEILIFETNRTDDVSSTSERLHTRTSQRVARMRNDAKQTQTHIYTIYVVYILCRQHFVLRRNFRIYLNASVSGLSFPFQFFPLCRQKTERVHFTLRDAQLQYARCARESSTRPTLGDARSSGLLEVPGARSTVSFAAAP